MTDDKPTLLPIPDFIANLEIGQTVYCFSEDVMNANVLTCAVAGAAFTPEGWSVIVHDASLIPYQECFLTYSDASEGLANHLRARADEVLAKAKESGE